MENDIKLLIEDLNQSIKLRDSGKSYFAEELVIVRLVDIIKKNEKM